MLNLFCIGFSEYSKQIKQIFYPFSRICWHYKRISLVSFSPYKSDINTAKRLMTYLISLVWICLQNWNYLIIILFITYNYLPNTQGSYKLHVHVYIPWTNHMENNYIIQLYRWIHKLDPYKLYLRPGMYFHLIPFL